MKTAALAAGPIRGGSVDSPVREITAAAEAADALSDLICLNSLDVIPSRSCLDDPCPNYCFYRDYMDRVREWSMSAVL